VLQFQVHGEVSWNSVNTHNLSLSLLHTQSRHTLLHIHDDDDDNEGERSRREMMSLWWGPKSGGKRGEEEEGSVLESWIGNHEMSEFG